MRLFTLTESCKKSLLAEAQNVVSADKIIDAIKNNKVVSIVYNENKNRPIPNDPAKIGKSWRYICPVTYGELADRSNGTPTGRMAVRAYQTNGSVSRIFKPGTNKGIKPAWKLFRVDRILAWYNQDHEFNPESLPDIVTNRDDVHFAKVIAKNSIINPENTPTTDNTGPIKVGDLKNTNIEAPKTTPSEPKNVSTNNIKTVDNVDKVQYNKVDNGEVNKIAGPTTNPVFKTNIQQNPTTADTENNLDKIEAGDTEPVTKDELNNNVQDNPITNKFKEMNKRWDDLENDEEI